MSASLSNKNRNVIPRWRDFQQTLQLGELASIERKPISQSEFTNSLEHKQKIVDWKQDKSISHAIELLNSSFIIDDFDNSFEAAHFLNKSPNTIPNSIKFLSNKVLNKSNIQISNQEVSTFENFDSIIKTKIHRLRNLISHNQNNPINWIELARLYLIIGKELAAEKCVLVAVQLSPDNRYISRISSRFFTHTGDYKKAKQILKLNKSFNIDPWLISADIGISTLQNKSSFHIKKGFQIVNTLNYSPFQLNELLSALATEELNSGHIKSSRKLYNQSLIKPNDNSLAQAVWAKALVGNLNLTQSSFENTPNVFEAKAYFNFHSQLWQQSYSDILQWFIDQPFSRDPAGFGSFVASSILEKYDDGIKFCKYGLRATPGDFILMNNLAFSYLKKNEPLMAQGIINKIHYEGLSESEKVIYKATKGLLMYKQGHSDLGEILYNDASSQADKIKDKNLKLMCDFHHLSIQIETEGYPTIKLSKLDKLSEELKGSDINYLNKLISNLKGRIEQHKLP